MLNFDFYSPEEVIPYKAWEKYQISVKRDDRIHPFISGNKWRKLKYTLADALQNNKKHIVTFGGAWSNHLVATACAGATFGFQTTAFVRADEHINNPVLTICQLFGMRIIRTNRTDYRDKKALFSAFQKEHPDSYFVDEGGHSILGAQGCAEIIQELKQEYNHIFVACGTGTTAAGLVNGVHHAKLKTIVNGVSVLKGGDFLMKEVADLATGTSPFHLHTQFHEGGYAKYSPELLEFIQKFTRETGILLEPTYTGKLFFAVDQLIRKDYFHPKDKILLLHTGGLTGLIGNYEQFKILT